MKAKKDQDKKNGSFEIVVPKGGSADEGRESVMEELVTNYSNEVKNVD